MRTKPFRLWTMLMLLVMAGCGYSREALIRDDIETVYVPVFDNRTFRRGLEVELTEALIAEINMRTHLRVMPEEHADSKIVGTITELREPVLTKTTADQILEKQVTVHVDFSWIDLRTGRTLVKRNGLRATKDFVLPAGENIDFGKREAFRDAARRMVQLMEKDW